MSPSSRILMLLLFLAFPAYPLVTAISSQLEINNTTVSLIIRIATIVLSIANIYTAWKEMNVTSRSAVLLCFIIFWVAYVLRIINDTTDNNIDLGNENSYYWIWAIGGCLIPSLALASRKTYGEEIERFVPWIYIGLLSAAMLVLLRASGSVVAVTGQSVETGRLQLEALNPIAVGNLGASLFLLSVWGLLYLQNWRTDIYKIVVIAGIFVGAYTLVASNSRGPLVSTVACLTIIAVLSRSKYRRYVIGIGIAMAALFVPLARFLQDNYNITTLSRMLETSVTEDASSVIRIDLYNNAIAEFFESPLLGSGLEEKLARSYPHNVILEAFMSTGVVFGVVFIVLMALLSVKAIKILKNFPQFGWPSLLFFQYAIGSLFSGSLNNSVYMWAATGMMISLSGPHVVGNIGHRKPYSLHGSLERT